MTELVKELRIGNWIEYDGKPTQVLKIDSVNEFEHRKGSVTVKEYMNGKWITDIGVWITNITPIPLTPSLLEKCGFVKDGFGGYKLDITPSYYSKGWKILCFAGDYLYLQEWDGVESLNERDIITLWNKDVMKEFYLHQLQNLTFALTGEELNIEL